MRVPVRVPAPAPMAVWSPAKVAAMLRRMPMALGSPAHVAAMLRQLPMPAPHGMARPCPPRRSPR